MNKTHWKKLTNPDYLGAYSIENGADIIATIKSVAVENVTGADGKKEQCTVIRFVEDLKPFICNKTNAKMIEKIWGTPYIEEWSNKKIQLYAAKVKSFGEMVEALRIRPFTPKSDEFKCECCGNVIAKNIYDQSKAKYGKAICSAECRDKLGLGGTENENNNND